MSNFKLKSNINISDCTKLLVTDVTGLYSVTNPQNLTGWNSGIIDMPSISNVLTATLTITTKDTAIPYVINVFPTLPSITGAIYTVLPNQIGYTTSIPTQILQVQYIVTGLYDSGTPFTFSVWALVGILCDVACCVDRLEADASQEVMCKCPDSCHCTCGVMDKIQTAMKAFILFEGLKKQICNKQKNMAVFTLGVLQNICNCN